MNTDEQKRFYVQFGERVQRIRRKRGLTQESLASLIGLSRTSVVNVERGRQKVLCHTLVEFLRALRATPTDLLPLASEHTELENLLKATPPSEQKFVRSAVASSERERR